MSRSNFWALLGGMGLLSGCGKLPGFSVNAKSDSFQQAYTRNDKIDLLFIVDNSGSMDEEQANLSASFNNFIGEFTDKELNFQIGVISTDTVTTAAHWTNSPYNNFNNSGRGTLLYRKTSGYQKILTSFMPDATVKTQFANNVLIGTNGSGAESGILSATQFLDTARLAGWNNGFIRSDAFLSIIVVSDEDESYGNTNSTYIKNNTTDKNARINGFLAALDTAKGVVDGDRSRIRFDAVVATDFSFCNNAVPGSVISASAVGTVYMEVAQTLSGVSVPVCTDFSSAIADIAEELVVATTRFHLAQPPDGPINGVYVNEGAVPHDATNGWQYLSASQEIEFRGTAIPSAGASIRVDYIPLTPL